MCRSAQHSLAAAEKVDAERARPIPTRRTKNESISGKNNFHIFKNLLVGAEAAACLLFASAKIAPDRGRETNGNRMSIELVSDRPRLVSTAQDP